MSLCVGPLASNRLVSVPLQFGVIGLASVVLPLATALYPSQVFLSYARLAKKLSQKVLNYLKPLPRKTLMVKQ